jgi:hypothetical protein
MGNQSAECGKWEILTRNATIFATIISTLCVLHIANIRSNVFFRKLSSESVKQFTTAIWCSKTNLGLTFVMTLSESKPTYFEV